MARLNELPVSMDTLETLRRKMLRQNRDLAKMLNIKSLRIRDLEGDLTCIMSENIQLRGRILELEKEVEDNEARRIADHAMFIKEKLESQLTEWATVLAGLGLEPPPKQRSPRISRPSRSRPSFSAMRPSPSQRRLRDVARDIEELGHIAENKSYSRRSMNPEQIRALRSEVDTVTSPELGPPPTSHFIDQDPIKVDSPRRLPSAESLTPSPQRKANPPILLSSPVAPEAIDGSPSPQKKQAPLPDLKAAKPFAVVPAAVEDAPVVQLVNKSSTKRKFGASDETEHTATTRKGSVDKAAPRVTAGRLHAREMKGTSALDKEQPSSHKDAVKRPLKVPANRKALAAKSTNEDLRSPKKQSKGTLKDGIVPLKPSLPKTSLNERPRTKGRPRPHIFVESDSETESAPPPTVTVPTGLLPRPQEQPEARTIIDSADSNRTTERPVETNLTSPNSPPPSAPPVEPTCGDTPPPADISCQGETIRPSRRARASVSYAEPNLRDKMRRPTKELYDAVTGEGRYARRSSQYDPLLDGRDSINTMSASRSGTKLDRDTDTGADNDSIPASPLDRKTEEAQSQASENITNRRQRHSATVCKLSAPAVTATEDTHDDTTCTEQSTDLWDIPNTTPPAEQMGAARGKRKSTNRPSRTSRRYSALVDSDEEFVPKPTGAARRRSMLV